MSEQSMAEAKRIEVTEEVGGKELDDASLEGVAGGANNTYMRINDNGDGNSEASVDDI